MSYSLVNKVFDNCSKVLFYLQKNEKWDNLEITFHKKANFSK